MAAVSHPNLAVAYGIEMWNEKPLLVVEYLPGPGGRVGQSLVEHPGIDTIAFTGSREVGLGIIESAAKAAPDQRNVKRVIAEMGGKNAIIIDDDADLDQPSLFRLELQLSLVDVQLLVLGQRQQQGVCADHHAERLVPHVDQERPQHLERLRD